MSEPGGKSRRLLVGFGAGLVSGVIAAIFVPALVRPYLPGIVAGDRQRVQGVVRAKQLETDRLLLTVPTAEGTILATFTRDVAEIDLLVQKGDSITLELREYSPFVDNPRIASVRPAPAAATVDRPPGPPTAEEAEPKGPMPGKATPPSDTGGAGTEQP